MTSHAYSLSEHEDSDEEAPQFINPNKPFCGRAEAMGQIRALDRAMLDRKEPHSITLFLRMGVRQVSHMESLYGNSTLFIYDNDPEFAVHPNGNVIVCGGIGCSDHQLGLSARRIQNLGT
ncbi:hypothetical protein J5N58_25545 [Rhizobium cremeum]|uniref:hypothetical protein n=1 Tax=Rhizobium cremeum TaxID=2813827 RepID=UPI001FD602C7|nr:hypothetical protein [Rhizobium cremeum]MCJ7997956.1 hypothetical protein [Rhizobium cremeum]MCJ8003050.1 hypothetical protein [Rhizobium cremeum]